MSRIQQREFVHIEQNNSFHYKKEATIKKAGETMNIYAHLTFLYRGRASPAWLAQNEDFQTTKALSLLKSLTITFALYYSVRSFSEKLRLAL